MARSSAKSRSSASSSLFSHRQLLMTEVFLLVGLGKEALEWAVLEQSALPPLLKVVVGMFVVVSTLGGLVLAAERFLRVRLDRTQKAMQRRYRLPQAGVHFVVLVLIFLAYAAFWDQETGALGALSQAWSDGLAMLLAAVGLTAAP